MAKTKLAIFDMDGLMVDSEPAFVNSLKTVFQGWNMNIPDEIIIASMGSNKDHCRKMYEDYLGIKLDDDLLWGTLAKVRDKYFRQYPLQPKKGIHELFEYCDTHNIKRALGTSSRPERVKQFLEPLNLYEGYILRYTGDMCEYSKPHPAFYSGLLEMTGYAKEEALVFEDSLNGLDAAVNAGIRCVLVPDIAIVSAKDRLKAEYVLKDLSKAIPYLEDNRF